MKDISCLESTSQEVIVGLHGKSGQYDGVIEFGITTVAKNVGPDGSPDSVYNMPELGRKVGMGNGEWIFDDENCNINSQENKGDDEAEDEENGEKDDWTTDNDD